MKTRAVLYRAELSKDDTRFGSVSAKMVSGVEIDEEIERSGRKILPAIVVFVEDPQSIK